MLDNHYDHQNKGLTTAQYDPKADVARLFHVLTVKAGCLPEAAA